MVVKLTGKDYLWSYIGVIFSLGSNVILLPFVMHFLEPDVLGLWYVFQNLAAITVLFDFGFSVTFSRNINYSWNGAEKLQRTGAVQTQKENPNFVLMNTTIVACRMVFLIISLVAFILLITAGSLYIRQISHNSIPEMIYIPAWCMCSGAVFLNLYYGYYGAFLKGVGAVSYANKAMVYSRILQIVFTIAFLFLGLGLIGTSIAYLIYGSVYRILAKRYFYRYKSIGEKLKKCGVVASNSEIKSVFCIIWHNAWREGIVSLSNYLANQASTIICSLYMPLAQTGVYSLAVQLITAVSQMAMVVYNANQPILQTAHVTNDMPRMKRTMAFIVTAFVLVYCAGVCGVVVVLVPLLRLIRPEMVASIGVILGVALYQLILNYRNCYGSYFSCTNRLPYVKAYIITAIFGVLMSAIFMGTFRYGVWGLIIAQIVSQLVFNGWYWSFKAHRELNTSIIENIKIGINEFINLSGGIIKHAKQ